METEEQVFGGDVSPEVEPIEQGDDTGSKQQGKELSGGSQEQGKELSGGSQSGDKPIDNRNLVINSQLEVGQTFADFESWQRALKDYQNAKKVLFSVRSSSKCNVKDTDKSKFPKKYVFYKCIHGNPIRKRGNDKRVFQKYMGKGCEAQINLKLDLAKEHYEITELKAEHSFHDTDEESFSQQSRVRRLSSEEKKYYVGKLQLDLQCKTRNVRKAIENETGKKVTRHDLYNAKVQVSADESLSDIARSVKILLDMQEKEPESSAKIIYDKDKGADGSYPVKVMFYEPAHMKENFSKFGDVMNVDVTYQLTNRGFGVLTFTCIDQHKTSHLIAWALCQDEKKDTLEIALKEFKIANQDSIHILKFIVVDKDYSEIDCLSNIFDKVTFIICQYHAINTVKKRIDAIPLSSANLHLKERLKKLFFDMLYVHTHEHYMEAYNQLSALAPGVEEVQKFRDYYDQCWHRHREHWSTHKLREMEVLCTFTNNRAENQHKIIKDVISKQSKVSHVIQSLIDYQFDQLKSLKRKNWEGKNKSFLPTAASTPELEILRLCQSLVSPEVTKDILYEFQKSLKMDASSLNCDTGQVECTDRQACTFNRNMNLPCAHLLAVRRFNRESMITKDMIAARFALPSSPSTSPQRSEQVSPVKNISKESNAEPQKKKPKLAEPYTGRHLRSRRNFVEAKDVAKDLAEAIAKTPDKERAEILQKVGSMKDAINSGQPLDISLPGSGQKAPSSVTATVGGEKVHFAHRRTGQQNVRGGTKKYVPKFRQLGGITVNTDLNDWQNELNRQMRSRGVSREWDKQHYRHIAADDEYLGDDHFLYAHALLTEQFTDLAGLQDTNLYLNSGYTPLRNRSKFVQIVHSGLEHWGCVANPPCDKVGVWDAVLYDSMTKFIYGTKNRPDVPTANEWQIAQMLLDYSGRSDRQTIAIGVLPCHQQQDTVNCGLYALANMVTVAHGEDPQTIQYTGNLRTQYVDMARKGKMTMFQHEKRSRRNEYLFKTTAFVRFQDQVTIPAMTHTFDIYCHCRLPENIEQGDGMIDCDKCKNWFHCGCYLLSYNVASNKRIMAEFLCYGCRLPKDYSFLDINKQGNKAKTGQLYQAGSPNDALIEGVAKSIKKLPSHKLANIVTRCINRRSENKISNVKQYEVFQKVMATYDLTAVFRGTSPIYFSMLEFFQNNAKDCGIHTEFLAILPHEQVLFALLLVCDIQKIQRPPLHPTDSGHITRGMSARTENLPHVISSNKKWLANLVDTHEYWAKKINDLLASKKSYHECKDDLSTFTAELKCTANHATYLIDQLDKAKISEKDTASREERKTMLQTIEQLLESVEREQQKVRDFQKKVG